MSIRLRRGRRLLGFAVIPVSIVGAGALVVASSYSVFTATTSSPSNSWTTGTVVLKNNSTAWGTQAATGSALFSITNLKPNAAATVKCLTVEYSGSLAAPVKMYATNFSNTNSLASYLNVTIETVSGATDANCTGASSPTVIYAATNTLNSYKTSYTSYASGLSTGWSPSTTGTQQFRITVQPDNTNMTNTQQGSNAQLDFVWEAQNS